SVLQALLGVGRTTADPVEAQTGASHEALLAELSPADEHRLIQMLAGLGQFDVAYPLLRRLAALRPQSPVAQNAYLELALLQVKALAHKGDWDEAKELLAPLGRVAVSAAPDGAPRSTQIALLNLLGVACCMLQDFDMGIWYFDAALKKSANDAWLHQNLALAYEWQGRLDRAETHWNRYFDLLDRRVPVPNLPNYLDALAFEGLNRLSDMYSN